MVSKASNLTGNSEPIVSVVPGRPKPLPEDSADLDAVPPHQTATAARKIPKILLTLLSEMRAAFGSRYGISVTLPSSYWYLRWFKPKEMEPYVDFFGLMTYDLHGPWDRNVKQIGKVVYGQTNIPEIYNWTLPLWYDGVNPAKINLGLAYYGRGYTLADSSCNHVGCAWIGTSRPAPCTDFGGVMSLREIETLIPQVGVKPRLLAADMMKELTWSNQWIGYDDLETIAMKKQWASSHCFGGTMIWSVDLYSGAGSGDTPDGLGSGSPGNPGSGGGQGGTTGGGSGSAIVYIDPSIWKDPNPVINCQPPCTFVLPPLVLSSTTTIVFPPYTTSLDVAWSEPTGWTSTVQTTTLTIPPLTTTAINVWEYIVTNSDNASTVISSFHVTPSVLPPPFTITDDRNPKCSQGVVHPPVTRTITPPPYPYTYTTPDSTPTTTTAGGGGTNNNDHWPPIPVVTFKPGSSGPICLIGCGHLCLIFCSHPCLLDCPDGGQDFPDPVNPKPPPLPPRPTDSPDPLPTGPPSTDGGPPPDPNENQPQNPEEEEGDQECALEFNLPLPTYNGLIGQPTATQSIAPPVQPSPSPSPPPNPAPPSPDPATESLNCYNSGAWINRDDAINAVNGFCNTFSGTVLDASNGMTGQTLSGDYGGACIDDARTDCLDDIHVTVTVINGCRFTVDGPNPTQDCGRILRETIDQCDTGSTQFKRGGTVAGNCALWSFDPNLFWG